MKRIFSEVQKRRIIKNQANLLIQDLNDSLLLIKNKRFRSAYIFLFDGLERAVDIYLVNKGEKPTTRREREELIFKYLSPNFYRKFRSFYYERRGGMYEDFLLITKRDFNALLRFFKKSLSELIKNKKNLISQIKDIISQMEKI